MKAKTKLIASIMSICLVCAVFAIGVFALKTANLKIGGDVSFSATGVEADIKNVTLTGATTNDQVLATGSINTSMTQADIDTTFQNWQSLKLDFDADATDIELKFDIANTSTNADNYIEIDYSYSFSNSSPNVDVFPGDENDQKVWENNEYILAPKGSAETATYETFTLKFKVVDKELNVPQDTKVSVNIELKHCTVKSATADANNVVTIDNVKYTLNSPSAGFATVTGHTITTSGYSAVIHPVVKSNAEGAVPCVVTAIGDDAFRDCSSLTTITIPSSMTSIGVQAFAGCTGLTTITIPNSVTSIGSYAFVGCSSLTSITIPNSVTSIANNAFMYCTNLASITIPDSVTSIGSEAFIFCTGLASITIPDSVTSIGDGAFSGCTGLTSITIPSSVTSMGSYAFRGCTGLTTFTIQNASIGSYAFFECTGLTTITIPSCVTSIEGAAFAFCTNLTSITIPSSVTSIGGDAFYNTPWYNNQPDGPIYINNVLYEYKFTGSMPAGTSIAVKEGTVSISDYAFDGCTGLTSITIPSSVTSIGEYAFRSCNKLMSVKFEETTNWAVADSADGARTPIAESEFTADASLQNVVLLIQTYLNKFWFRTVE